MIEVERLTKDYGSVVAVEDVSFRVGRREIVGFLGPNGAGKSTTLRILAGFLGPSSGSVRIDGHDVEREPLAARRSLGYMPETAPLYPEMRVREYLAFRAALKGVPRRDRRARVSTALERAAVGVEADTLIAHLSRGFRQRVALADALVAAPPLLILDEPSAGLDPNQIRELRALIRELKSEHTVLLSTHILSEIETTCDRALVIHRGRLVAEGSLAELAELGTANALVALVRDPEGRAEVLARDVPGIANVNLLEAADDGVRRLELRVEGELGAAAERVAATWAAAGVGIRSLAPGKPSLEEVFSALTRSAGELEVQG